MYSIAQVIYGIPLHNPAGDTKYSTRLEEAIEDEEFPGFLVFYSGDGFDGDPVSFGVPLDEFDPCCSFIDISTLVLVPTQAQVAEYATLWNNLPASIQQEITKKFGSPRAHILWSTS